MEMNSENRTNQPVEEVTQEDAKTTPIEPTNDVTVAEEVATEATEATPMNFKRRRR